MSQSTFTSISNLLAIKVFNLIAWTRNFRFQQVASMQEEADFIAVQQLEGFDFPEEMEEKLAVYKNGGVRFIAYLGRKPVGIIRLADPQIVNRPLELYGLDAEGQHHEIQHLTVAREYRDGSQFVMLGLFKAIYQYSIRHRIQSWISCSTRHVYRSMRRYSHDIQLLDVDFEHFEHPVTRYMYRRGIFDTCYVMQVNGFSPVRILRRFLKYRINDISRPVFRPMLRKAI